MQTLVLDGGGFSAGLGKQNKLKTEYLLKGFMLMDYDAVNLSRRDFTHGASFLREIAKTHQIPFVSANILKKDTDEYFAKPFIIKKFGGNPDNVSDGGGMTIGILGVTRQSPYLFPNQSGDNSPQFESRDPIKMATKVVKRLKTKVDFIICLAHLRVPEAKQLATSIPEIDVIILGSGYGRQEISQNDGKTRIISAGSRGKYVGELAVEFDRQSAQKKYNHLVVPLDESYQEKPELANLVAAFKKVVEE